MAPDDLCFKIVLVGFSGVGKRCLAYRFTEGRYPFHHCITIGVEIHRRTVPIEGAQILMSVWNSGCNYNERLLSGYVRNALAVLLVYDITNRDSFKEAIGWLNSVRKHTSPNVVFILVGNKSDLEWRKVETEEGDALSDAQNLDGFKEVSAKTGKNVDDVFIYAAKRIYNKIEAGVLDIGGRKTSICINPSWLSSGSIDHVFKFVILGEMSAGKTALMIQFSQKKFKLQHVTTINAGIESRVIMIEDKRIKLQIIDTSGQERFASITRSLYRDVAAALIVYDVTERKTFELLPRWLKEVRNNTPQDVAILLVGNKIDLFEERQVAKSDGEAFARDNDLKFMEVSAKTAAKVDEVFMNTAEEIYGKIKTGKLDDVNTKPNKIKLNLNETKAESKKRGCC